MLKKTIIAALLAKLALCYPVQQQQQQQDVNPNMPEQFAKHYVPSNVQTNTIKFPIMNEYCLDDDSSTTLLSIDGTLVPMMADAGWYTVTYGSQYSYADQIFVLNLRKTSIVQLTACFCFGNVFQAYDNGKAILLTDHCTWPAPTAEDCVDETRETDPQACVDSANFCDGAAILEPGYHNISIGVLQSPWGAGAAYIRVDTAAQANPSWMNLPLMPLCQIDPDNWTCNQNIVE